MSSSLSVKDATVLILGDGNFSFSLAYVKRFPSHFVVATSYDSSEALHAKYKEFERISSSLTSRKLRNRVVMLHNVDATSIESTLRDAISERDQEFMAYTEQAATEEIEHATQLPSSAEDAGNGGGEKNVKISGKFWSLRELKSRMEQRSGGGLRQLFDIVIFNFPHVGVEDVVVHRVLLAHYFTEAERVLKRVLPESKIIEDVDPGTEEETDVKYAGEIRISMCNEQPENWQAVKQANGARLCLSEMVPFVETEWPGYEHKRHHINKSFPITRSCTLVFTREEERSLSTHMRPRDNSSPKGTFLKRVKMGDLESECEEETIGKDGEVDRNITTQTAQVATTTKKKKKKKMSKAERLALIGSFHSKLDADGNVIPMLCSLCGRGFSSGRAFFFHARDTHEGEGAKLVEAVAATTHDRDTVAQSEEKQEPVIGDENAISAVASASGSTLVTTIPQRSFEVRAHVGDTRSNEVDVPVCGGFGSYSNGSGPPPSSIADQDRGNLCLVCGMRFGSSDQLAMHKQLVRPVKSALISQVFSCTDCERILPNERALKQHVETTHGEHL